MTVVSAVWLAATRCSASATRFARAPLRVGARLLLELAHLARELVPDEVLRALEQLLPSPRATVRPEISLELAQRIVAVRRLELLLELP